MPLFPSSISPFWCIHRHQQGWLRTVDCEITHCDLTFSQATQLATTISPVRSLTYGGPVGARSTSHGCIGFSVGWTPARFILSQGCSLISKQTMRVIYDGHIFLTSCTAPSIAMPSTNKLRTFSTISNLYRCDNNELHGNCYMRYSSWYDARSIVPYWQNAVLLVICCPSRESSPCSVCKGPASE